MPQPSPLPSFDLYAELGIGPDAGPAEVDQAWRARVRTSHPDVAPDGERRATERTARLNIAREWLLDPVRRARYDELRRSRPTVELPVVDPLGSWPARRRRRPGALVVPLLGLLLMVAILFALGAEAGTVVVVVLCLPIVSYVAIYVVVGAFLRRFGG